MYINSIITLCVTCLQFPYFHQLWKNICHQIWSGLPMPTSLYHLFLLMTSKQLAICMISVHFLCFHHFWHMTVNSVPSTCTICHTYATFCLFVSSYIWTVSPATTFLGVMLVTVIAFFIDKFASLRYGQFTDNSQNQILMLHALLIITKFVCGLMLNCTFNIKYLHL